MTDRVDTNQDLTMTLATIGEQLEKAVDPAALIEGVGAQLGVLYNNAEAAQDESAKLAIQKAWDDAQLLVNQARHSQQVAATALDIAGTLQTQRDEALEELGELTEAVDRRDLNHPKVAAIYEEATDEGYQDGYENAMNDQVYGADDDYAYDLAWEMMEDKYGEAFGYDAEAIARKRIFMDVMSSDIEIQPARKREFFAWLDAVKTDNEAGDDDE